jgi:RNA polymerase sigma factor (sigma-70 family)
MTAVFPGDHDSGLQVLGEGRARRGVPARLLRLASDERLVDHVRAGSEAAFEALFDRHHRGVLGFCRHMLGSVEEAEDAVQHTFLSAYRELVGTDKHVQLRPWLYTIARNRCLTMLRGRSRMSGGEVGDPPTEHLAAAVERRVELRELLRDVAGLPEDQRAALVLSELGDMPHDEIADVLSCRRDKVKALVFQARSSLIASRTARETPCGEIREQLANLRGGALRRNELRRHVNDCAGCREFRDQLRAQRRDLALVLPVAPTVGLKSAVLGGGSAAAIASGTGGAAATGAVAAKVLVAVALAGGGTIAAVETTRHEAQPPPTVSKAAPAPKSSAPTTVGAAAAAPAAAPPSAAVRPGLRSEPVLKPAHRSKRKRHHAAKLVPPGQAKKDDATAPLPPGQAKKDHATKLVPPGQAKPEKAAKPIPPGHSRAAKPETPPKAAKPGKATPKAATPPPVPKPVKAPKPVQTPRAATPTEPAKPVKAPKAPKPAKPPKATTQVSAG